jgi:hypothetical protein
MGVCGSSISDGSNDSSSARRLARPTRCAPTSTAKRDGDASASRMLPTRHVVSEVLEPSLDMETLMSRAVSSTTWHAARTSGTRAQRTQERHDSTRQHTTVDDITRQ